MCCACLNARARFLARADLRSLSLFSASFIAGGRRFFFGWWWRCRCAGFHDNRSANCVPTRRLLSRTRVAGLHLVAKANGGYARLSDRHVPESKCIAFDLWWLCEMLLSIVGRRNCSIRARLTEISFTGNSCLEMKCIVFYE